MPELAWSAPAIRDFLNIIDHIAARNPTAAQAMKDRVDAKTRALIDAPRLYREGRVPGTREMVVHPNYIVVYRETAERVTILRLLHAAQMWP